MPAGDSGKQHTSIAPFRITESLSLPFRYFTKLGHSNFRSPYPVTSGRDRTTFRIGRIIVMGSCGRQIQKRTQTNPPARNLHGDGRSRTSLGNFGVIVVSASAVSRTAFSA